MSYFDEEYEYLPWNTLSEKEEIEQEAWQKALSEHYNIKFGKGSVISKKAHIYEVESAIFGDGTQIGSHALLRRLNIECGENCSFNSYCVVHGRVKMGSFVRIAPGAKIFGENHGFSELDVPICRQKNTSLGITIGDDCWIGANAVITDGVTLGKGSIVAAGAVVTHSFPDYSVLGGSPARVIKNRLAGRKNDEAFKKMISDFGQDVKKRYKKILSSYFDGNSYAERSGEKRRAVCDAVEIAAFFDDVPRDCAKEKLVDEIKSFQRDECDYESVLSASYALEILGEKPLFFSFADEEWGWDETDKLKWSTDAWDAGHIVDIYATAKYFNKKYYGGKTPERLFTWLSAHISPRDGLWGEGDTLLRVNGYYRTERGTYSQFEIPVPNAEKTIDSILSHAEKTGVPTNACNALDIVHPLFAALKTTSYRRSEAEAWCVKMLPEFLGMIKEDGFPFATGEKASLKGTEMWLSIIYTAASILSLEKLLGYTPKGVHRI